MAKKNILLKADGIINVVLGILLLLFPFGVGDILGMPPTINHFYTTILGGVIFAFWLFISPPAWGTNIRKYFQKQTIESLI